MLHLIAMTESNERAVRRSRRWARRKDRVRIYRDRTPYTLVA